MHIYTENCILHGQGIAIGNRAYCPSNPIYFKSVPVAQMARRKEKRDIGWLP